MNFTAKNGSPFRFLFSATQQYELCTEQDESFLSDFTQLSYTHRGRERGEIWTEEGA